MFSITILFACFINVALPHRSRVAVFSTGRLLHNDQEEEPNESRGAAFSTGRLLHNVQDEEPNESRGAAFSTGRLLHNVQDEEPTGSLVYQLLSTNDVYKVRGDRWNDDGFCPYALEGNLIPPSDPDEDQYVNWAWANLNAALEALPDSFHAGGFQHHALCGTRGPGGQALSTMEKGVCKQRIAAKIPEFGHLNLREIDTRFDTTGNVWREDSLGCLESFERLSSIITDRDMKWGGLPDMGMTYLVESEKFKQNNGTQESFSFLPGDYLSPSFLSFRNYGKHMTSILDNVVDYVTLGNHEFDFKTYKEQDDGDPRASILNDILAEGLSSGTRYKSITANVRCKPETTNCVDDIKLPNNYPNEIKILDHGKKMCIFGVTSDLDAMASDGDAAFEFIDYASAAIKILKSFKAEQCDLVVGMTHLDLAQDLKLWYQAVRCFAANLCPHLDVILGAHNHQVMLVNLQNPFSTVANRDYTYIWKLGQDGHLLSNFHIDVMWKHRPRISLVPVVAEACRGRTVSGRTYQQFDDGVTAEETKFRVQEMRETTLGLTFRGRWDSANVNYYETRAGNLFADASAASNGGSQIAALTAGMTRADRFVLMDGPLSVLDIHEDFPFPDNVLHQIHVSVWQLVSLAMEGLAERRNVQSGCRLIISGLEIVYRVHEEGYIDHSQGGGLRQLLFVGRQHALGTRTGSEPPTVLFRDGQFLVDPNDHYTLCSNSYHLNIGSEQKELMSLRFAGEIAKREDDCQETSSAEKRTSLGKPFACDGNKMEEAFYRHMDHLMINRYPVVFEALTQTQFAGNPVFHDGVWTKRLQYKLPNSKGQLGSGSIADSIVDGIRTYGTQSMGREGRAGFVDNLVMLDRNLAGIRWRPDRLEAVYGQPQSSLSPFLNDPSVRAALKHWLDGTGLSEWNSTAQSVPPHQRAPDEDVAEELLNEAIDMAMSNQGSLPGSLAELTHAASVRLHWHTKKYRVQSGGRHRKVLNEA